MLSSPTTDRRLDVKRVPFNRNVGLLDSRAEAKAAGIAFDEKPTPRGGSGNKDLAMDRKRSQSIGGLGREVRKGEKEKKGSGCCLVA